MAHCHRNAFDLVNIIFERLHQIFSSRNQRASDNWTYEGK